MNETVSLLAAVVSAIAAAIGTMVSVAQWRASRPAGAPPVVAPVSDRPARDRPVAAPRAPGRGQARIAAVALVSGAITAVLAALGDLVFWVQQSAGPGNGHAWEPVLSVLLGGGLLASAVAAVLGLSVVVAGLVTRRKRSV
ncbi:MAG TPA: hypothetical protein VF821_15520 [Lentzea sp.]